MIRNLLRSFSKSAPDSAEAVLQPHRTKVEFALVLVSAESDNQLQCTLGSITESAPQFGGTVLQIMGSLVLFGFSGVVGAGPVPRRSAFVEHIVSKHRIFVRVVHGTRDALVGTVGCDTRFAYTAVLEDFGGLLRKLGSLPPGQSVE
jgi:hypothetical protein